MNDTTTTTTDTDIMRRWHLLFEDWMRRVEATRGNRGASFHGNGMTIGRHGQLRMKALSDATGDAVFELSMGPGDTQVRITFPSGDTYLV